MNRLNPKSPEIPDYWRIGFEVEVVLGDLNDPRFDGCEFMDEADARYCQVVASELTRLTGEKWTAPRGAKSKPGFFVLPEPFARILAHARRIELEWETDSFGAKLASRFTSAILKVSGNAGATKTLTACCASTFRKARISASMGPLN